MNELIAYKIPIKGLSSGEHDYHFHITQKFFEAMQSNESYPCDIRVDLVLNKEPSMMVLRFRASGTIDFECDVCLDRFTHIYESEHRLIVKTGTKTSEDDDLVYLEPGEHRLDVSGFILEDILLNLPLRKVHPLDAEGQSTCNAAQLALLKQYGKSRHTDHRWDALKNIHFEE